MRAFGISARGAAPGPLDLPARDPGPGEISVAIEACGLNFADLLMAEGSYQEMPEPPFALGMELAGRVLAAGEGAHNFPPGTQVAVFAGSGGLAETGCFASARAVALPPGMPAVEAAAFQVAYGTSHLALWHRARLRPGETLVVLGAAGGVGLTAVEVGRLMGARVVAVARGAERLAVAEAAGAHHLIDSATADLRAELKALGGADVIYDPVGGEAFEAAFRAARPEARILAIGFASGSVPQVRANHLLVKNLDLIGFYWGGYLAFRPELVAESLRILLGWYAEGRLRPHIGAVLPLDRAAEGLALLRERRATGKVVVTI
ncbi:MAG: NADPH:quinone oxidoreductase family protein [Rhodobacteraceae bacterium]|nr:NADPH:quinone oxidoreductase family protein [Paracoccaceae bacterium]